MKELKFKQKLEAKQQATTTTAEKPKKVKKDKKKKESLEVDATNETQEVNNDISVTTQPEQAETTTASRAPSTKPKQDNGKFKAKRSNKESISS